MYNFVNKTRTGKTCRLVIACLFLFFLFPRTALPLPEKGTVEVGSATFDYDTPGVLSIAADDNTVINFETFDIAIGEIVNFKQPKSDSSVLSRVAGEKPSFIDGRLLANGYLFFSNPNGIRFGPTASVEVNRFVASSLNIQTKNFQESVYDFENTDKLYNSVLNQGTITSLDNVALIGPAVKNEGVIIANAGKVALASGDVATVTFDKDGLINVAITTETAQEVYDFDGKTIINDAVANPGIVQAKQVLMTAKTADGIFESAVNHSGLIQATDAIVADGTIRIVADKTVKVSGTLEAQKGNIVIKSDERDIDIPDALDITALNTDIDAKLVTIEAKADVDVQSDLILKQQLELNGSLDIGKSSLAVEVISGPGTITTGDDGSNLSFSTNNAGNVRFTGTATYLPAKSYSTLILQGGGTAQGNISATNLTLSAGTLALGSNNLTVSGTFSNAGTVTTAGTGANISIASSNVGTMIFGNAASALPGKIYSALTLNNGGTAQGNLTASTLSLTGTLNIAGHTLNATALSGTGTISTSGPGSNLTLPNNAGNVTFTANATQLPAKAYSMLTLGNGGTAQGNLTASTLDLTGTLNIAGHTLNASALSGTGTISTSGNGANLTLPANAGNVIFTANAANLPAKTYTTLTLHNGGTAQGDITVTTLNITGVLNMAGYTLNAGTITGTGSVSTGVDEPESPPEPPIPPARQPENILRTPLLNRIPDIFFAPKSGQISSTLILAPVKSSQPTLTSLAGAVSPTASKVEPSQPSLNSSAAAASPDKSEPANGSGKKDKAPDELTLK